MIQSEPIPSEMEAVVLEAPGILRHKTLPVWPLEEFGDPDLMLLKVGACGVCGSDYRYFAGENPWAQHTLGRHVPNPPNIVLGHEYSGVVVAVASEENTHWLGKRVAPICSKVCGQCEDCLSGREHLCEQTTHLGHGQGWGERACYPGAYAEYTLAWGRGCYKIPEPLSFEQAAMMDILAVAVHIVGQSGDCVGKRVLCIGAGPAGNAVAQAALAGGAAQAVLFDTSKGARQIAAAQGMECVGSSDEISGQFYAVFDTVGTAETLRLGLQHLAKAGTLVNVAVHDEELCLNPLSLGSERRLVTSCNFERGDFEQALAWLADGEFRVDEWFTRVRLSEIPERFERRHAGMPEAFKLLITSTQA